MPLAVSRIQSRQSNLDAHVFIMETDSRMNFTLGITATVT